MKIWLNGMIQDIAGIDATDRGFLLADGLFETLAVQDGVPLFLDRHVARLTASAATLRIPFERPMEDIRSACMITLRENDLTEGPASLRLTLTRGSGPRGLALPKDPSPTFMVTANLASTPAHKPMRLMIPRGRRNQASPTANLKTLAYIDQVLAKQEALDAGFDDALMRNTRGDIACASAANFFCWHQDRLLTPPLSDGVLPGITRQLVLEIAAELGWDAGERTLTPGMITEMQGAFLTNALIGLTPISAIGETNLPTGPRLEELHEKYSARQAEAAGHHR